MTDKYSITTYCSADGEYVAGHMREMDAFECRAAGFATPLEAIQQGFEMSTNMKTGSYNGVPLCVWGEVPDTCGGAVIWQLGTDEVKHHKRAFMVESKKVIESMLTEYEYLTNVVCLENKESVRWLKWLGAQFQEETAMIMGKPFARFYIERSEG